MGIVEQTKTRIHANFQPPTMYLNFGPSGN